MRVYWTKNTTMNRSVYRVYLQQMQCFKNRHYPCITLSTFGWIREKNLFHPAHKQAKYLGQCRVYILKWNESGFRPPLCTYRLNWARRTSWGWWDEWDDNALQTQDSKFEPWLSEADNSTTRSRRILHNIASLRVKGEETFLFLWNLKARVGLEPAISDFPSRQL